MNKREEFEKALEVYAEECLFDGQDSGEGEYAVCGPTEPLRLEVMRLFDAAQPSQDGLPKLPAAYMQINRPPEGGDHVLVYTADQMRAYGALCRAAALEQAAQIVEHKAFPSERARFGVAADAIRSGDLPSALLGPEDGVA